MISIFIKLSSRLLYYKLSRMRPSHYILVNMHNTAIVRHLLTLLANLYPLMGLYKVHLYISTESFELLVVLI